MYVALIPPLVAILGAALTKRIIPALAGGLLAGTFVLTRSFTGTFLLAGDQLAAVVANPANAFIILFLFCFGSFSEILVAGGGISAFAQAAQGLAKSKRGAPLAVLIATPVTFLDCCFHVISTSTISRPLLSKSEGSAERLAMVINITSGQLVALVPFATTYVGYIVGLVGSSLAQVGWAENSYSIYLSAVFLNFYSILMVLLAIAASVTDLGWLTNRRVPNLPDANLAGEHHVHEAEQEGEFDEAVPPRLVNLLLPLAVLLASITYVSWLTGRSKAASFFGAISNADFEKSIFVGTIVALVFTFILYLLQKVPAAGLESRFLRGGNELLPPIVILILAWSIAAVTEQLGFGRLIQQLLGANFPRQLIPLMLFLTGAVTSYFMGSSWGTWALTMPIGISLAASTGANLALTIGAVLAGGSVGDSISPLGETPVLTATLSELSVNQHVGYVFPFGILSAGISAALYLLFGYLL